MYDLTREKLVAHMLHSEPRPVQLQAFEAICETDKGVIIEIPTGEGKTEVGMTVLKALAAEDQGPLCYVTPTKTQVEQIARTYPMNTLVVMGRSEYPCLYYQDRDQPKVDAQQSPCYMLKCGHRVNQDTGEVLEEGAMPCPYFQAKFHASHSIGTGKIVVCTTAFFLTNRLLVNRWREAEPVCVVLDEAHRVAKTARGVFEFTITDYHLDRMARILMPLDRVQARILLRFRAKFMAQARKRDTLRPMLVEPEEIEKLLAIVHQLDSTSLETTIRDAIESGRINPLEDRAELKLLEDLLRNIPRFISSFRYALPEGDRQPLNYVVASYLRKDDPEFVGHRRKSRYHLTIKGYYVVPLIKRALGNSVVAMSATVGDAQIFGHESGLRHNFFAAESSFLAENTRIFLPTDTPDLSYEQIKRRRDTPKKARKMLINAAKLLITAGHRCLVVVVSDEERQAVLVAAATAKIKAISYGNGTSAKDAAKLFAAGDGEMLVGTVAHYSEGVDLPDQSAPVIFFLRPGYSRPDDPEAQFEQRRFTTGHCWALWKYRVMLEALQVRGRNVRSATDKGVCIFISQQFRSFLYGSLPKWLQPAYVGNKTLAEVVQETIELLS